MLINFYQLFINIVDNQVDEKDIVNDLNVVHLNRVHLNRVHLNRVHLNRVQTKGQRQSHWSSDKGKVIGDSFG